MVLLALLVVGFGAGSRAAHAGPNSAVLVVEFGDGYRVVREVEFSTPTISGIELIHLSGLDVSTDGSRVCRVGPDGCALPDQDCWCSAPTYWYYFYWTGYVWSFVCPGPSTRVVSNGAVEYLLWGSSVTPKPMDTSMLFDETRLAPGIPSAVVNDDGSVRLTVQVAGDSDGDGSVSARYRRTGGAWSQPAPLLRTSELCTLALPALPAGAYDVELLFADGDGVRGSTAWQTALSIPQQEPSLAYLPLVGPPAVE